MYMPGWVRTLVLIITVTTGISGVIYGCLSIMPVYILISIVSIIFLCGVWCYFIIVDDSIEMGISYGRKF